MSPKVEVCRRCQISVPLEWTAQVYCSGRLLPGTGEWRSQLIEGRCAACAEQAALSIEARQKELSIRLRLIALGGGEKPYREFSFASFRAAPGNERAFRRCQQFESSRDNLYLWGACGVGKTHLAFAVARKFCEAGRSVEFIRPPALMRRVRMKDPEDEQRAINRLVRTELLVLDDLGIGSDTAYARQIFQEILDGRTYAYRAGLVITSKYSLDSLAQKLDDDTISSRLAGLCEIIEVQGADGRLGKPGQIVGPHSTNE